MPLCSSQAQTSKKLKAPHRESILVGFSSLNLTDHITDAALISFPPLIVFMTVHVQSLFVVTFMHLSFFINTHLRKNSKTSSLVVYTQRGPPEECLPKKYYKSYTAQLPCSSSMSKSWRGGSDTGTHYTITKS